MSRFWWHWTNDTDDSLTRRTQARSLAWGDTFVLGLPDLHHSGRAWLYAGEGGATFSVEWGLGPHSVWRTTFGFGAHIDGDDRDLQFDVKIPFLGYLYLTFHRAVPRWLTFPQERRYTTYEPHVFLNEEEFHNRQVKPVEHRYMMGQDVDIVRFNISGDRVYGALFSIGEHMQSDGKRRFYAFWPDWLFGRADCTEKQIGPPVQAVACFPEGRYTLTLQREIRTWKRPRWPWAYWRKSVDVMLERPPEFQGKGENSWDCGPDAIYGMSSPGHSYEDAVAAYVKAVLRERARRGHLAPEHRTLLADTGVRP